MEQLQPDFSDHHSLFNYSYEFLEPYFYQRPVLYPVKSRKTVQSRKGKTRSWYSRLVSVEYGVKGSIQNNNMYNKEIAPYSVRIMEYQNCEFASVLLHFYSIDDTCMRVLLNASDSKSVEYLKDAVYMYLDKYPQLQTKSIFEEYFISVTKDAQFSYD